MVTMVKTYTRVHLVFLLYTCINHCISIQPSTQPHHKSIPASNNSSRRQRTLLVRPSIAGWAILQENTSLSITISSPFPLSISPYSPTTLLLSPLEAPSSVISAHRLQIRRGLSMGDESHHRPGTTIGSPR